MPTLAPPPPQCVEIRPLWNWEEAPRAEGVEGKQIRDQIGKVCDHWQTPNLYAIATPAAGEQPYQHVPFAKVKTIRVRYLPAKPLPPRRFNDGEE